MEDKTKAFLGSGLHFPVGVDPLTGKFRMCQGEEDIREAIGLIIGTRKGSRVMHPEFGCGIHSYVFGMSDYTSLRQMEYEVKRSLIQWEPRIVDIEVHISPDDAGDGCMNIKISYRVRSTNNGYNLVYPYYINEGFDLHD